MNCFYHMETESIASCRGCGRALCSQCANALSRNYCRECIEEVAKKKKNKAVNELAVAFIFFAVAFFYSGNATMLYRILYGLLAMVVYFGWLTTKTITGNISISASPLGWLLYITFRIMLATMIGIFVFPYKLFSTIGAVWSYSNIKKRKERELL